MILESVAQVADVAADDIPPTSHALPLTNVFRADVVRPCCRWRTCWPAPRPPSRTGSGCRGSWGRRRERPSTARLIAQHAPPSWPRTIAAGETSAVEVTQAHLDRIAAVDDTRSTPSCTSTASGRWPQAAAVDAKVAAGEQLGPLAGVPLALKDVLDLHAAPRRPAARRSCEGWIPPYDATVTQRLLDADIVILGKTNMDEFAMGSSTENSAYGPTHNPWDTDRIPGGSGGGSAAALAAFEAPLAIGTDTGGSIRQPAVGHRHGRGEADLRRHLPLRPGRHGVQPRPARARAPGRCWTPPCCTR